MEGEEKRRKKRGRCRGREADAEAEKQMQRKVEMMLRIYQKQERLAMKWRNGPASIGKRSCLFWW